MCIVSINQKKKKWFEHSIPEADVGRLLELFVLLSTRTPLLKLPSPSQDSNVISYIKLIVNISEMSS